VIFSPVDRRSAADKILMGRKASAALRLEHVIGEDIMPRDVPVRNDVFGIDVLVGRSQRPAMTVSAGPFPIKAVHLTAVVVVQKALARMAEVAGFPQRHFFERNCFVVEAAGRRPVRAREGRE
jgi:hypothetical protein